VRRWRAFDREVIMGKVQDTTTDTDSIELAMAFEDAAASCERFSKAYKVFATTFSACTYRNDRTGKLAVANVYGRTVVFELLYPTDVDAGTPAYYNLHVTLQDAAGEVWGYGSWHSEDIVGMIGELTDFLTRHDSFGVAAG
jgi:hypothetical protein